nr:MAG TPA: type VI secretion protein [Caudoviricetes sp.]
MSKIIRHGYFFFLFLFFVATVLIVFTSLENKNTQ